MSTTKPRNSSPPVSLRQKILGALGTALLLVGYGAYALVTGQGLVSNSFVGQDLQEVGDRFARGDLVGSDFTRANLSGIDMFRAQLHDSTWVDTIATSTNLEQADFRRATLERADLRGANLVETNFTGADLTGADLRGADIRGAIFDQAILIGADLRDTTVGSSCATRQVEPLLCEPDQENCCHMSWLSTRVEGLRACRTPYGALLSTVTNDNVGVIGEPDWAEVNDVENGMTYCAHDLLR